MSSSRSDALASPALPAALLDDIQAFVAVAQLGSFTAAALRLGRDGSSVSRRVGALEARLGVRLVERTTRSVALTEAGSAYLARMAAVLEEIAEAGAELSAYQQMPHGLLRITMPRTFGRLCVAPWLSSFMRQHPNLRVEAHYADHLLDLVSERFDVAIRLGILGDSSLVARRVAGVERRLVASATYLRQAGAPRQPRDLTAHRCLGFAGNDRVSTWLLRRGGERIEVPISPVLRADDPETLVMAALDHAGIAVATDWLLERHPSRRRLVPVLKGWSVGEESAVHVVTPAFRHLPAKTRAFVDMAMTQLRSSLGPT